MASKHSKGKRAKQKELDEELKTSKNKKKKQKLLLHSLQPLRRLPGSESL